MMGIAGVRKWCVAGLGVLGMLLLPAAASAAPAAKIEQIVVKTKAPKNPEVTFHCRIPRTYRSADRLEYRILVYFGGRNTSGRDRGVREGDEADAGGTGRDCFRSEKAWQKAH